MGAAPRAIAAVVGVVGCVRGGGPTILADADALSEGRLNAVVAELVPLVEEAAGARFEAVPYVRLGRPSDVERILRNEAERVFARLAPEVPAWLREREIRGIDGAHVSGKYALEERILLVSPEAMVGLAAGVPDDPLALDHVTRLVLAHELAHALQDRAAATGERFGAVPHYDALEALRAVTEGHAGFVERRVAEDLGIGETVAALDAAQGWGEAGPSGMDGWPLWAVYGQGRAFVDWHHAAGGPSRIWQVVREPPLRTRTTFVPGEYGRERPVDDALVARLDGAEGALGDGRWFVLAGPLVEKALRRRLAGAPEATVEAWLAAVEAGAWRTASREGRTVTFFLLRRPGAGALDPVRDHAEAIAAFRDRPGAPFRLAVADVDVVGAEQALAVTGRWGDDPGAEVHAVWAVAGDEVIVVEAAGFRPGIRLTRAVERLLAGDRW